jgi:hypothetical protein
LFRFPAEASRDSGLGKNPNDGIAVERRSPGRRRKLEGGKCVSVSNRNDGPCRRNRIVTSFSRIHMSLYGHIE